MKVLTALTLIFFGFIHPALAQFHTGPIAKAVGGAGRAALDPGEITYLNPAAAAFLQGYVMGFDGSLSDHAIYGNQKEWGGLFADNVPDELVGGSLSYQHQNSDYPGGWNALDQDIQISIAGFLFKDFAFGITAHRLIDVPSLGSQTSQTNGGFGLLWAVLPNFGLAVTALDLVPMSDSLAEKVSPVVRLVPTYALGANLSVAQFFNVRFDIVRPTSYAGGRNNLMFGLQTFFRPEIAFRIGENLVETLNQNWITAGIGFRGPKLSCDYTFEKDVRQAKGARHSIDLWFPF